MNRSDRAKQFAPFEALTGLREALRKKEKEVERNKRFELSEDGMSELQNSLLKLERGDNVVIVCFEGGEYKKLSGKITKKDTVYKYLELDGEKFFFTDIYKIEIKS